MSLGAPGKGREGGTAVCRSQFQGASPDLQRRVSISSEPTVVKEQKLHAAYVWFIQPQVLPREGLHMQHRHGFE